MEKILVILNNEAEAGELSKISLETLNAAKKLANHLNAPFIVGLIGQNLQATASTIAACGATHFIGVDGKDFSVSRYSTDVEAISTLAKKVEASIIMAPQTTRMQKSLPGVAVRMNGKIDTKVATLDFENNKLSLTRWYYRQRMQAKIARNARPWIILVESGAENAYTAEAQGAANAQLELININVATSTVIVGIESASSGEQTIRSDAELLFVAGAGWCKKQSNGSIRTKEAEELIKTFLKKTQSSLGSSKSLVDQQGEGETVLSFLTHLNQIGQTGSTPRHAKGLSTCCHGEEPHVVGWRFINERRAISMDPNCGWAQGKADVLYVADAFEVMAEVNKLL